MESLSIAGISPFEDDDCQMRFSQRRRLNKDFDFGKFFRTF